MFNSVTMRRIEENHMVRENIWKRRLGQNQLERGGKADP